MYGGHITDHFDRITNNTYLDVLVEPKLLQNMNLVPSNQPIYRILDPNKSNYSDYQKYIEKLPTESPQMFGMHPNAEINFLTNQCDFVFENIIDIQGGGGSGSDGEDGGIVAVVQRFKESIPDSFNLLKCKDAAEAKCPPEDEEKILSPYDTVALQETEVMNTLLKTIWVSQEELELGLAGALNMTDSMEALAIALQLNRVPANWGLFYLSKRPLNSWYTDLAMRCKQLSEWSTEMIKPRSVCLSMLFNPMSFQTAVMQYTARSKNLPLDEMAIQTDVTWFNDVTDLKADSEIGSYIHGFFLEGAAWENSGPQQEGYLIEQKLKELHPVLPVIEVVSVLIKDKKVKSQYMCPVYYTTVRGAAFIFKANLNMESEEVLESKWILSGTSLILNEDF